MLKRISSQPLTVLLIVYLLCASAYSVITPMWEASDEQWHYPMVKTLADNRLSLPLQAPGQVTAWRQEGSQPPLYYMLGAVLTFWIDTSDMDTVRWINPHADIGVIVPDGNYNMAIHDPAVEGFPWRGTVLAVHLVRLLSVLLGAVTVAMTYQLAQELFPERKALWIGAALFTALNPMFLFISGSVNNDNLSTAVASVLLVQVIWLLKRTDAPSIRTLVFIGVMAGAGMLAKFNIGFFLPLIALVLGVLAYRLRDWRLFVRGALITGGLTIVIAGWWYVRNWQLYGDPTGLNVFLDIVGRRTIPATWAQLWSERDTFLMSYWGFFGGLNVPLPMWMYTVFNAIAAVGIVGCVVPTRKTSAPSTSHSILLGRAITLIWVGVLFVGLIRWTTETWASQGRLMFAAIAPISVWVAVGLWRLGRWLPRLKAGVLAISGVWFAAGALIAAALLFSAYRWPTLTTTDPTTSANADGSTRFYETDATATNPNYIALGEQNDAPCNVRFEQTVQVGAYVTFCQTFDMPAAVKLTRDWTVFIHLVNAQGLIVAQRDVYPGQGQLPTRLLDTAIQQAGYRDVAVNVRLRTEFSIKIPDFTTAPQTLTAQLGFYDPASGERMLAARVGADGVVPETANVREIGRIDVQPRASALSVPNPMSVNFGDEAELVGYDISKLVMQQGDQVTVTLYWRGKRPLTTDYRVFVQIVQPNTTNVFASHDGMPAEWTRPTSTWKSDEIIEDKHTFTIPADAPLDTWQLSVGMYELVEAPTGQQFRRLRVITPDGGMADDFLYLTRVKFVPKR